MKSWLLVLALLGGGEQEKGVALYEQGRYDEAIAAFRRAEDADGPSAELSYNLALALWKAGQLDEAETEAERAATLSDGRLSYLRDGVLGNLRFATAKSKEAEDLQGALAAAEQARDHYLRGAAAADAPELARNLERSLRLIEELRKKIDEQKKEEKKDQQKQDESDKKDDKKSEDDQQQKKQDDQQQQQKKEDKQEEKQGDPQQDQQQQQSQEGKGEEQPEPQPQPKQGEEKQPEPQQQSTQDEQQKGEQQPPSGSEQNAEAAPGEHDPTKELTPEQKMQLLRELEKFDQQLQKLRALQRAQRPKVEKDW